MAFVSFSSKSARLKLVLFGMLAYLFLYPAVPSAIAQKITVQLLNGRTGKPMKRVKVYINLNNSDASREIGLSTDSSGEAIFDAHGEKTFHITPIGSVSCGAQPIGAHAPEYSVAEILRSGIVSPNTCSGKNAEPLRGHLIYFVVPASWWQMFKN